MDIEESVDKYLEIAVETISKSVLPIPKQGNIVSKFKNGNKIEYYIDTVWQQTCFDRNRAETFSFLYCLTQEDNGTTELRKLPGFPMKPREHILMSISPSLSLKAIIVKETNKTSNKDEVFLEVWGNKDAQKLKKSINLSSFEKHGDILSDICFSSFEWSDDENKIVYVAEKKKTTIESFFKTKSEEKEELTKKKGNKYDYSESWGEQLTAITNPVICVINIKENILHVVPNIPEGISPAQPQWGKDNTIVFEGIINIPFRLGRIYCENRASSLCSISLDGSDFNYITSHKCLDSHYSLRVSPCKSKIVFIYRKLSGNGDSHRGPEELKLYNCLTKEIKSITASFPFYIHSLPKNCWLENDKIVLTNARNAEVNALIIDTETLQIIKEIVCSSILEVQSNVAILTHMNLDSTGARISVLLGEEHVDLKSEARPSESLKVKSFTVDGLVSWSLSPGDTSLKHPLIVCPHGGPHGVYTNSYIFFARSFCLLGYEVLLVNYRGSTSFNVESLNSLLGNVGTQDVNDTHNIVLKYIKYKQNLIDHNNVFVFGGSHGGFIGAHLIGQYPNFYRSAALRNPVINLSNMYGTSDIIDWVCVEAGIDYSANAIPNNEMQKKMLQASPIVYTANIIAPVLLCVGGKDARVPPSQSIFFFKLLKANRKTVKMLYYPDDCHPLSNVETEGDVFINVCKWFFTHKKI